MMMTTKHKVVMGVMQDSNHPEYFVLEALRCSELRRRFMTPERKAIALVCRQSVAFYTAPFSSNQHVNEVNNVTHMCNEYIASTTYRSDIHNGIDCS
jgi:hypothetical protein